MLEPPDLDDLAEKSSLFFLATVGPPLVDVGVSPPAAGAGDDPALAEEDAAASWSVDELLCLDGDRWMAGGDAVRLREAADRLGVVAFGFPDEEEAGFRAGLGDRSSSRELPRSGGKRLLGEKDSCCQGRQRLI